MNRPWASVLLLALAAAAAPAARAASQAPGAPATSQGAPAAPQKEPAPKGGPKGSAPGAAKTAPKEAPKSDPGAAKPDEAVVRERVGAFHKAWKGQNWKGMVAMMTPDLQRCANPNDLAGQLGRGGAEKLVAWSITSIEPRPKPYADHLEIECTGESVTIDAVMHVVLTTTLQAPGAKPKKMDGVEQTWVKVNGEWDLSVAEEVTP